MFEVACGGAEVLKVIKFIWILLDIVFFLVPMGLIVMISIDLLKNVIAGKVDDMKKNVSKIIKRVVFCMALFLVEPICGFVVNQLGNIDVDWAKCVDIAITTNDFSEYEVEFPEFDNNSSNDDVTNNSDSDDGTVSNDKGNHVTNGTLME